MKKEKIAFIPKQYFAAVAVLLAIMMSVLDGTIMNIALPTLAHDFDVTQAIYVNLKATKTIGRYMKLAVFVNRIIDHLPDYMSNGLTVRRSSSPYFGMELNVKI